jgi:uncharacterized protein (TIGR02246 family)
MPWAALQVAFTILTLAAAPTAERPAVGLSAEDIAAIKQTRHAYIAACLAGNWAKAIDQWTADGVRMVSNGQSERGRAALRRHFDGVEKVLAWDETWDDVQGSGDVAYARTHGTLTAKLTMRAEPLTNSAQSLTVFRKQPGGRWLIAVDCYNSDPTYTP